MGGARVNGSTAWEICAPAGCRRRERTKGRDGEMGRPMRQTTPRALTTWPEQKERAENMRQINRPISMRGRRFRASSGGRETKKELINETTGDKNIGKHKAGRAISQTFNPPK